MRRRTERKATTQQATTCADIAANGAAGSGKDREVAESGPQHTNPTEHAEVIYAEVSEEHSADRRLTKKEERELLNNTTGKDTCSSSTSVTKASPEVVYTHEENQMERGPMEQEKETGDTLQKTNSTTRKKGEHTVGWGG
jgi:hypothetical protein